MRGSEVSRYKFIFVLHLTVTNTLPYFFSHRINISVCIGNIADTRLKGVRVCMVPFSDFLKNVLKYVLFLLYIIITIFLHNFPFTIQSSTEQ